MYSVLSTGGSLRWSSGVDVARSSPTARVASFAGGVTPGTRRFGVVSRRVGPGRGVFDRVRGVRAVRVPRGAKTAREPRAAVKELFSRIQHDQRPECLELAPTARAQWPLMVARKNCEKNDSAKPRNAVTQGAICTWVARLRPSDRGAIAVITCAGTPAVIRAAARHRRCLL